MVPFLMAVVAPNNLFDTSYSAPVMIDVTMDVCQLPTDPQPVFGKIWPFPANIVTNGSLLAMAPLPTAVEAPNNLLDASSLDPITINDNIDVCQLPTDQQSVFGKIRPFPAYLVTNCSLLAMAPLPTSLCLA
jgi:hypothetical protein